MKFLLKRRLIIASIAASVFASPAYAIFGVFDIVLDPSNLVQNTASALAAVKNEVNTANSYITQMQQLVAMGKSLKSVSGLASLAGVEQELALYVQLKSASTQLAAASAQSLELSQRLQAQYGASSMSWQDFLRSRAAIDQGNTKGLATQYATVTNAIEQISVRRKEIVEQLQGAEGQTSAMQSVGAGIVRFPRFSVFQRPGFMRPADSVPETPASTQEIRLASGNPAWNAGVCDYKRLQCIRS